MEKLIADGQGAMKLISPAVYRKPALRRLNGR